MIIRCAHEDDARAVAGMWNAMIRETLATFTTQEKSESDVAQMIRDRPGAFWVAQTQCIAGFVTFGPFRTGPGYAATVEHTVIIEPAARAQGVGRALMRQAKAGAKAKGAHIMVAGISSANPDAVAFHAALGFQQTALMPQVGRKAGHWLDLLLMQKTL